MTREHGNIHDRTGDGESLEGVTDRVSVAESVVKVAVPNVGDCTPFTEENSESDIADPMGFLAHEWRGQVKHGVVLALANQTQISSIHTKSNFARGPGQKRERDRVAAPPLRIRTLGQLEITVFRNGDNSAAQSLEVYLLFLVAVLQHIFLLCMNLQLPSEEPAISGGPH